MIPYLDVLHLHVYDRIPHEVYCALRVTVEGWSRYGFRTGIRAIRSQPLQPNSFLRCFGCRYVLGLSRGECRAVLKFV